jgi:hypothetical protein
MTSPTTGIVGFPVTPWMPGIELDLALLGPDGLLSWVTNAVLERALAEEITGQRGL